jgi:tetraacyldisaccharide 4'-kinase
VEPWLTRVWYGRGRGGVWLLPLSWLFGVAVRLRQVAYRRGVLQSRRLAAKVVVVGNLTVGGTGKTPLVAWLASALAAQGHRVGIVARGYGGAARTPMLVEEGADAAAVGDEPALLRDRTRLPVAIGRDRAAAAQLLVSRGVDLIVSDDGLQHYALARDAEIAMIDAERGLGNGRLLPAGPLREALSRLRGVDAIVLSGCARPEWPDAVVMRLGAREARPVGEAADGPRDLERFAGTRVHAVAGIGNPARFFALLRRRGIETIEHTFPDHHAFVRRDLDFEDALPVLMTEKDAVKCRAFADARLWYVPVECEFEPGAAQRLLDAVQEARWTRA